MGRNPARGAYVVRREGLTKIDLIWDVVKFEHLKFLSSEIPASVSEQVGRTSKRKDLPGSVMVALQNLGLTVKVRILAGQFQ